MFLSIGAVLHLLKSLILGCFCYQVISDWVLIPPSSKIIKKLFLMLKKFLFLMYSRYNLGSKQEYSLFQNMDIPKYST